MSIEVHEDSDVVFRLDRNSGVPAYLQLVQQVEHAIHLGYLRKGDQLPRVKELVAALSINPNTVLKAYHDLEQKGLTAVRPGQGTFVEAEPQTVDLDVLNSLRQQLVKGWLREARDAGLDREGALALITIALQDIYGKHDSQREPDDAQGAA